MSTNTDALTQPEQPDPAEVKKNTDFDSAWKDGFGRQSRMPKKLEEDYKMPYVSSWEKIFKKDGEARGLNKGKTVEKLETAKRMIQDNLSIATIAKYTGLSEKKIQSLMH